jgi:hypothetical protein
MYYSSTVLQYVYIEQRLECLITVLAVLFYSTVVLYVVCTSSVVVHVLLLVYTAYNTCTLALGLLSTK